MANEAFLGIDKSSTGKRWIMRPYDERITLALTQRYNLPDLIAKCLSARGIGLDQADLFLDPKLRDLFPDPGHLKDMDKAAQRFVDAIKNGQSIAVFGDYDVDGATSSALLIRFAEALGVNLRLYIPDRIKEGYGPNAVALEQLAHDGVKLVICVDCGTTAHDALARAAYLGLDVIVLDHHASEADLPRAYAVVNPNRLDENSEYTYLAAVGVTYLFVVATNRVLRTSGFYNDKIKEPDLLQYLDLVALGTVCDVVKLNGLNRGFVAQGLKIARGYGNTGVKALAQIAGVKAIDTYALGFLLGPRVNAGGRVGEAHLGAKLLSTNDSSVALSLAEHLNVLNSERRDIEAQILEKADRLTLKEEAPLVFVASDNWHSGVIGIVASRLKEKYNRPAIVIALDGDVGKGSGRSLGTIDLGSLIIAAKQMGLILNGGGHKMAAGFTVARDKVEALREFLSARIAKQILIEPLIPSLTLDGMISGAACDPSFVQHIEKLGPFGSGNSEPRFALADCKIIRADIVGDKHVSVIFMQGGQRLRGIAFRAMDSNLGQTLLNKSERIHLAGYLRLDEWQGEERVQIHINDAAIVA